MRGHMWLNKVASVLGPILSVTVALSTALSSTLSPSSSLLRIVFAFQFPSPGNFSSPIFVQSFTHFFQSSSLRFQCDGAVFIFFAGEN